MVTDADTLEQLVRANARIAELEAVLRKIRLESLEWHETAIHRELYFTARGYRHLHEISSAALPTAEVTP